MAKETNNGSDNNLEEFIRNLDIDLVQLEKLGASLLIIGYSNFLYGADLDILEALEINNTGKSPDTVTLYGQKLVLTGYIFLWIVAVKRVYEKNIRTPDWSPFLSPYIKVANAYLLSVIANSMRVEAFTEIASFNGNKAFIE